MSKEITGKKSGKTSLRMEYSELHALPGGKQLHEAYKAHWEAGAALDARMTAILSKKDGIARKGTFRFGGVQVTLIKPEEEKAVSAVNVNADDVFAALAAFKG